MQNTFMQIHPEPGQYPQGYPKGKICGTLRAYAGTSFWTWSEILKASRNFGAFLGIF